MLGMCQRLNRLIALSLNQLFPWELPSLCNVPVILISNSLGLHALIISSDSEQSRSRSTDGIIAKTYDVSIAKVFVRSSVNSSYTGKW